MTGHWRLGTVLALLVFADRLPAQYLPSSYGNVGFKGRKVAVVGVWPYPVCVAPPYRLAPYGTSVSRLHVQVLQPVPLYRRPLVLGPAAFDLDDEIRGVDLDLVPAKASTPAKAKRTEAIELPRLPALPGVDVSVPRKSVRPEEAPKPEPEPIPPPPPPPALPPPSDDPAEEYDRLVTIGLAAFREQDYGVAALRFRQAAKVLPHKARAHLLLVQAELALGRFQQAVQAIETGMRRQMNWPGSKFQPRADLYKGIEAELDAHLKRLEETCDQQAKNGRAQNGQFLFLLAYQLWFDGRRQEALMHFRRARALVADPSLIDEFLRAAQAGVIADGESLAARTHALAA